MGSKGIKRRKRPPKQPGGSAPGAGGNWEMQNSPFTFEGQLEGLSRFGRGVRHASPQARVMAYVVALVFIIPFAIGVVLMVRSWLVD
jgi:hypothetical protein